MNNRHKILALAAAVMLCLCGGFVAAWWGMPSSQESVPQVFYALAENHLKAFQKEDFSSAYALTSANLRKAVSKSQFKTLMQQYGLSTMNYRDLEFSAPLQRGDRAELDVRGISGKNGALMCRYYFVREKGEWRVESFQLCAEPKRPRQPIYKSI